MNKTLITATSAIATTGAFAWYAGYTVTAATAFGMVAGILGGELRDWWSQ